MKESELAYSINLLIDSSYNEHTISEILQKGTLKGITYYQIIHQDQNQTIDAIKAAASLRPENSENGILITIDNTTAQLSFFDNEDRLEIQLSNFEAPRLKGNYIDWTYYLKIMLDIVDLPIIEIECKNYSFVSLQSDGIFGQKIRY